jgi:hypothetical protein
MFPTVAVDVVHVHSICGKLSYVSHCCSGCGSCAFYLWPAFLCFLLWQWMWSMCILLVVVSFLIFPTVAADVVHVHSICGQLSHVFHCDISCGSSAFYLWSAFLCFLLLQWMWFMSTLFVQLSYASHCCSGCGSCAFFLWSAFICLPLLQLMWFMCILFVVSFLMFPSVAVDVVHVHSICGQLSYFSHCGSGCGSCAFYLWSAFL